MLDGRSRALREQFLELCDGGDFLELSLVQVHLVALFKNAHEFDTVERG